MWLLTFFFTFCYAWHSCKKVILLRKVITSSATKITYMYILFSYFLPSFLLPFLSSFHFYPQAISHKRCTVKLLCFTSYQLDTKLHSLVSFCFWFFEGSLSSYWFHLTLFLKHLLIKNLYFSKVKPVKQVMFREMWFPSVPYNPFLPSFFVIIFIVFCSLRKTIYIISPLGKRQHITHHALWFSFRVTVDQV